MRVPAGNSGPPSARYSAGSLSAGRGRREELVGVVESGEASEKSTAAKRDKLETDKMGKKLKTSKDRA